MRRPRLYVALTFGVLVFASAVLYARLAYAGPERITVTCGTPATYDSQSNTMVVPITVKMGSGQPDTIDMTYTALDANNNPVSCDPASNKLSVSKTSNATDNVSVTYTGANPPVLFTAVGSGECYGFDTESDSVSLFHRGPTAVARTQTTNPITIGSPQAVTKYSVPVTIGITGASNADRVQMTYTAVYTASGTQYPLLCVPATETVIIPGPSAPVLHNVVIDYSAAGANPVTFVADAKGISGDQVTTTATTLPLMTPTSPVSGTALTLTLGTTAAFKENVFPVTIQLQSGCDVAKIKYSAEDSGHQELHCRPSKSTIDATTTATVYKVTIESADAANSAMSTFNVVYNGKQTGHWKQSAQFNP